MFAGPIESKQKGGARRAEFLRSPHSCASLTQDAEGWGVWHGVRGLGERAHGGAGAREGRARGVLGTLAHSSFFFRVCCGLAVLPCSLSLALSLRLPPSLRSFKRVARTLFQATTPGLRRFFSTPQLLC